MSLIDLSIIICGSFLIVCVSAASGFYLYIKHVKKISKIAKQKAVKDHKRPQEVISDGVLAASSIVNGAVRLELFAKNCDPKYIIGVNRGGWLLSTYLAQRLNIDRNRLLRFDSDKNTILDNEDHVSIGTKGSILLIDDISRTGDSLQIASNYLKNNCPSNSLSIAVLVICAENKMKESITYYPYYTRSPDVELPWSSDERKAIARARNVELGNRSIPISDAMGTDSKSPLRMSDNNGEGIDIVNSDIDLMVNAAYAEQRQFQLVTHQSS